MRVGIAKDQPESVDFSQSSRSHKIQHVEPAANPAQCKCTRMTRGPNIHQLVKVTVASERDPTGQ